MSKIATTEPLNERTRRAMDGMGPGPKRVIRLRTRWPMQQTGETEADIIVPMGTGPSMVDINQDFIAAAQLSPKEVDIAYAEAEEAVLRSLMVIRD